MNQFTESPSNLASSLRLTDQMQTFCVDTLVAPSSLRTVLCTGRTTQAEGCPGLFGRPGVSAFRIRNVISYSV
jgi:hypothetical protein